MKTTKIWLGVGVAVIAGANATVPAVAADASENAAFGKTLRSDTALSSSFQLAQNTKGQGGENETGEGGVDAAAADKDPVKYGIALQVIAAHYYAGLAAYEAGETQAGTELFAHGFSEVYAELEEVFKKRGVKDLGAKIEAAIAAANKKAPAAEVKQAVDAVLSELTNAEKAAPKSSLSRLSVRAQILADTLDRAAAQYVLAAKQDATLETYLDGLGFSLAAQAQSRTVLPEVEKIDPAVAKTLREALALVASAYPGLKRNAAAQAAPLLAAASTARIAVSRLP
ncbi:MAG TPA: hypothetical protein PL193_01205 [Xanthobacteraceae bacterium]|nr:hypothetical protein [Xanthobacteraceae bacterium]